MRRGNPLRQSFVTLGSTVGECELDCPRRPARGTQADEPGEDGCVFPLLGDLAPDDSAAGEGPQHNNLIHRRVARAAIRRREPELKAERGGAVASP